MPHTRAGLLNISHRYGFIMFIGGIGAAEFVAKNRGQLGRHCIGLFFCRDLNITSPRNSSTRPYVQWHGKSFCQSELNWY